MRGGTLIGNIESVLHRDGKTLATFRESLNKEGNEYQKLYQLFSVYKNLPDTSAQDATVRNFYNALVIYECDLKLDDLTIENRAPPPHPHDELSQV